MIRVTAVLKNSSAAKQGLKKGDKILKIGDDPAVDELDLLFYAGEEVRLTVEGKEDIFAYPEEFEAEAEEKIRTCRNHCIFCFVDQMPGGMRDTLYIKDDDYTMSFECGNFVTLTNLSDEELDRILRLKLSPLYISVHAIDPEVRCSLMRNRFAGKIKEQIERLARGGIEIHCQAVIVPNVNDGEVLEETARTLFSYFPNVRDLAVVPTGLTKYRDGLTEIPDIDGEYSWDFLDTVDRLNREFGINFVLPADEYYIRAGRDIPPPEFYGDFSQIENGIGMTSKLIFEFTAAAHKARRKKPTRVLCVCGTSAEGIVESLCKKANEKIENLEAHALAVKNNFFGESVTCSGLLTGRDILAALEKEEFDEAILPSDTLKSFEDVFLCGMTLKELRAKLKRRGRILINQGGGEGLFSLLAGEK